MNSIIIDNVNAKVMSDDELYFLGDFAFGDKTQIPALRARIICKNFYYIEGNHDHAIRKYYKNCFSWYDKYFEFEYKGILFCNFHYPIGSWNEMHHGAINCYGHCHSTYKNRGRQLDVGVDANSFQPLHIDEVLEKMLKIDYKSYKVDHHSKGI